MRRVANERELLAAFITGTSVERHAAFEEFSTHLPEIVWAALAKLRGRVRDVVDENALLMHVRDRLEQFDETKGTLSAWLRIVIRNWLATEVRRDARVDTGVPFQPYDFREPSPDIQAMQNELPVRRKNEWTKVGQEISDVLTTIAWKPNRAIDWYAVVLLWTRISAAHISENAEVALALSWTREDERRRIRRDLPTVSDTWYSVREHAANAEVWNSTGFHPVLAEFLSRAAAKPVNRTTVEKWKSRACQEASNRANAYRPGVWEHLIAPLMADHRKTGNSKSAPKTKWKLAHGHTTASD